MPIGSGRETVAERVARGDYQNSAEGGAIVPFSPDTDLSSIYPLMAAPSDGTYLASFLNGSWSMRQYLYRWDDGRLIFVVLRFDKKGERKKILPLRCERLIGCLPKLSLRHLDNPRPLYNLHHLADRPDAPVIVVEGEKAADAAAAIFPDYVCTTWIGGAQSVGVAELLPLAGRSVTIWPDNDAEGVIAAEKLAARLMAN